MGNFFATDKTKVQSDYRLALRPAIFQYRHLAKLCGNTNGQRFATFFTLDVKIYRQFRIPFTGVDRGNGKSKAHHVRLGFYSLNVTNHGNYNAVFNNVTAPKVGQFVGFMDRREGAVIDFVD